MSASTSKDSTDPRAGTTSETVDRGPVPGPALSAEPKSEAGEHGHHEPSLPFSKARCIALVATVTGASFLNTLSAQAVVIILPTIGRELDIPDSRVQWIVSSYSLTFATFLLLWGRMASTCVQS
ncbi:hypothetical protein GGR57DRAFT_128851 [Xylariaceae sp. FL1272]|nr:hypothetical protein GGR57DRAFT_128851 [Xylariaceae sp. FL1272]